MRNRSSSARRDLPRPSRVHRHWRSAHRPESAVDGSWAPRRSRPAIAGSRERAGSVNLRMRGSSSAADSSLSSGLPGLLGAAPATLRWSRKIPASETDPNEVTPSMPANTAIPIASRISLPAPLAVTSGITPMMKANEVMRIGRSRNRHASIAASTGANPALDALARKLHDQDRILAREPDQHDEADLGQHIVVRSLEPDAHHRATTGTWAR